MGALPEIFKKGPVTPFGVYIDLLMDEPETEPNEGKDASQKSVEDSPKVLPEKELGRE